MRVTPNQHHPIFHQTGYARKSDDTLEDCENRLDDVDLICADGTDITVIRPYPRANIARFINGVNAANPGEVCML